MDQNNETFIDVPVKQTNITSPYTEDLIDSEDENDVNNGALLVHSLAYGKPNLSLFMSML